MEVLASASVGIELTEQAREIISPPLLAPFPRRSGRLGQEEKNLAAIGGVAAPLDQPSRQQRADAGADVARLQAQVSRDRVDVRPGAPTEQPHDLQLRPRQRIRETILGTHRAGQQPREVEQRHRQRPGGAGCGLATSAGPGTACALTRSHVTMESYL